MKPQTEKRNIKVTNPYSGLGLPPLVDFDKNVKNQLLPIKTELVKICGKRNHANRDGLVIDIEFHSSFLSVCWHTKRCLPHDGSVAFPSAETSPTDNYILPCEVKGNFPNFKIMRVLRNPPTGHPLYMTAMDE
jgi:hypothetical protein